MALSLRWKALGTRLLFNRLLNHSETSVAAILVVIKRYPYWLDGHLYIAERALQDKDIAMAYAAAQTVVGSEISLGSSYRKRAGFLIARCHLAKGDTETALEMFERWKETYAASASVQEEIAACLIALSRFDEARAVLESIEGKNRSQEGSAALLYLKNKLKG